MHCPAPTLALRGATAPRGAERAARCVAQLILEGRTAPDPDPAPLVEAVTAQRAVRPWIAEGTGGRTNKRTAMSSKQDLTTVFTAGRRRHPPRRHRRAGAPDAGPGAHRRAPRPEDRHVRLRLPRLAGGHARRGVPEEPEDAAGEEHPLRRRPQRRPRRHRRVGHPDAAHRGQAEVRRRHRHVVRQGAGRGPLRRRAQARQLHRHRQERRRARHRRRRPELQELLPRQPVRAHAVPRRHAVAVPGQRPGDPRLRPARLHDVALVRAVGRS